MGKKMRALMIACVLVIVNILPLTGCGNNSMPSSKNATADNPMYSTYCND